MTDYKLVPVEPTHFMLVAGVNREQVNPEHYGRIRDTYRTMLAAAPAVQGEPVARLALCIGGESKGHVELAEPYEKATNPAYWSDAFPVYAAPQPAEQQPAPDVPGLTEALRQYQHSDGSGLVFGYDKLLVDQHVAGLVAALEGLLGVIGESRGVSGYHLNGEIAEWDEFLEVHDASAALATYRKQGGEA